MIVVPTGQIGMDFAKATHDTVSGNRTQWFTYHLLDNSEAPSGGLAGVKGGVLEWHANAPVHGGGKITVVSLGRSEVDWLNSRVHIVMHIEGKGEYPLGVYIPSAPAENWDDMNLTLDVELLDKCSILDSDYVLNTHSIEPGTNVTQAVRNLIESTGEHAGSITETEHETPKALLWESGTSKLQIINDLLEAAGFFSLQVDGNGKFRAVRFRAPKNRPLAHEFKDDVDSIYSPAFTYERDIYSIPNKVVLIAPGDGDEEAMRGVATNMNPNSPYSYQRRGRWIIDVVKGVEATSQEALDERALARLESLTSSNGTVSINHAPLPWLGVTEVVRFKRDEADLDMRAVVASTQIELDAMALQRTALQEVADV